MSTISGTWPTLAAVETHAGTWAQGLTRRGKPPRDDTAHRRKLMRILLIAVGYGLVGAGVMRWLLLGGI